MRLFLGAVFGDAEINDFLDQFFINRLAEREVDSRFALAVTLQFSLEFIDGGGHREQADVGFKSAQVE